MPLRFLRDIIFNDNQADIPDTKSMQHQLNCCGIFTLIEMPLRSSLTIFIRETIYYTILACIITIILVWILVPCVENFLTSLPDSFFVHILKDVIHSIKV